VIDPSCPDPLHRLYALVGGPAAIAREQFDARLPTPTAAIAALLLRRHGEEDQQAAAALMVEAGHATPDVFQVPASFWRAVLRDEGQPEGDGTLPRVGTRPGTGVGELPPIPPAPASRRPHGRGRIRRGPKRGR
jgi:hypothetical protein